jgi:hypothetical protein
LALALSGCSWLDLPSLGSLGGSPRATNPAIEACRQQARAQDLDTVGEDQVMPSSDGRYRIVLAIQKDDGFSHATCDFDPAKGVEIKLPEPPPKPPDVGKDAEGSDENKDSSGSGNAEGATPAANPSQPAAATKGTPSAAPQGPSPTGPSQSGPAQSGPAQSGPAQSGAATAGSAAGPTRSAPASDGAGPSP